MKFPSDAHAAGFIFPNGVLVQEAGKTDVWEVSGGRLHRVPNPSILLAIQRGRPILPATSEELSLLSPPGIEVGYPVGTFVKRPHDPKIYMTDKIDGRYYLRWVPTIELYEKFGGSVKGFIETDVATFYQEAEPISNIFYPSGLVVRGASSDTVYELWGTIKRRYPDLDVLAANRDGRAIITLPDDVVAGFVEGYTMGYPFGTLIQDTSSASRDLFLIDGATKRYIPDVVTLQKVAGDHPAIVAADVGAYTRGALNENVVIPANRATLSVSTSPLSPGAIAFLNSTTFGDVTKVDFSAPPETDITVQSLTVEYTGTVEYFYVEIGLFEVHTLLASSPAGGTKRTSFPNLNWVVPAGNTNTLTIRAKFSLDIPQVGTVAFGISSPSDIVFTAAADLPTAVMGNFPAFGTTHTVLPYDPSFPSSQLTLSFVPLEPSEILFRTVSSAIGSFVVMSVRFDGDPAADYVLDAITVTHDGTSSDPDFSSVWLEDQGSIVGSVGTFDATSPRVTFLNLGWTIPAGTSRQLNIVGTIAPNAPIGDYFILGIETADDVVAHPTLSAGSSIAGEFPIVSDLYSIE
ncbi:MAG: hypothetical protein HY459_00075 [Parcubacteria group bacterium]|nr:hypothetical protein [Parcubacteria group bacterium]